MTNAPPQLAPLPQPIGVLPAFTARTSETLVMREKLLSWSGNDYSIKTMDGRDILRVHGEAISMRGRCHIIDMAGQELFMLRKHSLQIGAPNFFCENPNGDRFLEITGKFAWGGAKSEATFTNSANGQPVKLHLKGDFFAHQVDITDEASGQPVAQLNRKWFNSAQIFGDNQTYAVTVAPGMDMTVIVAMCIAMDERRDAHN